MLKYWRILLLVIMVSASLLAIGLKPQYTGVQVAYVYSDSPAKGTVQQGMIISEVNGKLVQNSEEWDALVKNYTGDIKLKVNKNEYKFHVNNSELGVGIEVNDIDRFNLDFGLDIKGGTRIILRPKENASAQMLDQVIGTLQTRANIYGLREIRFLPIRGIGGDYYVQIEASGVGREIVDTLLSKQGNFEAKITKPVYMSGGKGTLDLGDNKYTIEYAGNETITVANQTLKLNGTFVLDDVTFEFVNITSSGDIILFGSAYRGDDIELVYTDAQHSGIMPGKNYFEFYFGILVSEKGASRFAKITSGIPSQLDLNSGDYYLKDCRILLFLDNQLVSDLRISSNLGGKAYTTPQITGSRETRETALEEKLKLQTILRSGALPVSLETVSVGVVSPTLGGGFMNSIALAMGLAALVVMGVIFARYRKLSVSLPIAAVGFSEVVIILGIAANSDAFIWGPVLILNIILIALAWWKKYEIDPTAWIGAVLIPMFGLLLTWTIDLPVISGIIATLGVGVDSMIVIADETLSRKAGEERKMVYTIRDKIKRAFFIIFGSASTIIAAMVPLMAIGIGFVRGFAITTIIGVLVGVLVTRPAYAEIVEVGTNREKPHKEKHKDGPKENTDK
jgi:preprotein translocase subunit SecD